MLPASIKSLAEIDAAVRKRQLRPRAIAEETGLTNVTPIREPKESDSYWFTRVLTHSILGMHYRTPQLNLYLLQDYLNARTFGQYFVKEARYVAPRDRNLNFETQSGTISFYAREEIDPKEFLKRFRLEPEVA
jgi:hypothetical protein